MISNPTMTIKTAGASQKKLNQGFGFITPWTAEKNMSRAANSNEH
jgi:hypothetical protein